MLSSTTVKRKRCRFHLQSPDLSGACLGSWLPTIAFRHVHRPASFRSAPLFLRFQLAPSRSVNVARRFAADPLHTAMPVPCLRKVFQPSVQGRTAQVRSMGAKLTFVSLCQSASERCSQPAHHFVPPVQPAARQALQIVDRAAKQDQDTNLSTVVESNFSTFFRKVYWGKDKRFFSTACQFFLKIRERLFAGISTMRSSSSAFFCASGAMSRSRSRTPQRGSRAFRLWSKAALEGAV